jgi:hypothetical protein
VLLSCWMRPATAASPGKRRWAATFPDDSDGTLPLHRFNGSEYCLGASPIGAYQEIPSDVHNRAEPLRFYEEGAIMYLTTILNDDHNR